MKKKPIIIDVPDINIDNWSPKRKVYVGVAIFVLVMSLFLGSISKDFVSGFLGGLFFCAILGILVLAILLITAGLSELDKF